MLIDFEFQNCSSFLNLTNLSLEADRITEFNNTIIEKNNLKLLPIAAIFGPNESGKSNLITAFQFFQKKIIDNTFNSQVKPFIFSKKWGNSFFSVKFLLNNKIVNYSFTINDNGLILSESLKVRNENSKKPKQIFRRDKDNIKLNRALKKYEKNLTSFLDNKTLLLNFFKNLKEESINKIYQWIKDINIISYHNNSEIDWVNLNLKLLLDNPDSKKRLLDFLSSIGSSIQNIFYKYENRLNFYSVHNQNKQEFVLPLINESTGTLKMIGLFAYLFNSLSLGIPLFIDELDSKLHTLLLRYILVNFINPDLNPNHAQLIFTSHDFSILNMNLLRRDEIWFVEKFNNVSELYSLSDFRDKNDQRIRKDRNFLQSYFLGQFGSIPNIKDFPILNFA